MQQPELSPTSNPSAPRRPVDAPSEPATARPVGRPRVTVRLAADQGDAVVMVATAVLVVATAFLGSATEATGTWLAVAGIALAVVLVARAFRGAPPARDR